MTSDAAATTDLPELGDRYVVDATIGTGGMASVSRGHDRVTNEPVAIKRLHDHLADEPHFEKIMLDEARLQTLVRHPNVVATLAVGRMSGRLTLVLELVQGSSLTRLLRVRGALEPALVVEIACQMLAGLAAAHEAHDESGAALELVHRDVSPQNVLVDRTGAVKLADFGVARARSRLQTTTEGRIKGKLAYMSPEQIEGHPLDARSDLFSTGAVLWELCTGTRLFRGESEGEIMRKVLSQAITSPADGPLGDVILKSLARDPAERWQTATEMIAALEKAHSRAGREALAAITPELQSAVHVVTKGASAFAPTVDSVPPIGREGTESISRERVRRPKRWPAAAVIGVVAVLGALVAGVRTSSSPTTAAPSAPPSATASPAASAPPSASSSTPTPTPMASASAPTMASTTAVVPTHVRPPPPRASVVAPAPSAAPSTTRPSCDPPYRIDERGVRVFKTECL